MSRFKIYRGFAAPGIAPLATVSAKDDAYAKARVAASRGLDARELVAVKVQERQKLTCGDCGWVYLGRARGSGWFAPRCTLCDAKFRVAARRAALNRAVRHFVRQDHLRALQKSRQQSNPQQEKTP